MIQLLTCPLCDWTEESETSRYAETNKAAAPAVADALGMPPDALLAIHHRQALRRDERALRRHFEGHEVVEWARALMSGPATAILPRSILDVARERATHEGRGWTAEHDAKHGAVHLIDLAVKRAVKGAAWVPVGRRYCRGDLVKAASLLVAAIDLLDVLDALDTTAQQPAVQPWEHPGHKAVQHRDRKPPWCDGCGWSSPVPATPAVQVREVKS